MLDLRRRRPPVTRKGLRRAVTLTEIAGVVLIEVVLGLAYRRRQLRWRVQGAVGRWENDFLNRRPRRAGGRQVGNRA